jgi:hypothetical protein
MAYLACVVRSIDDADASFLESVAIDFQRQIGRSWTIESVGLDDADGVAILVTVGVGAREVVFRGIGANLVAAYADLRRAAPELILATAYRELVSV